LTGPSSAIGTPQTGGRDGGEEDQRGRGITAVPRAGSSPMTRGTPPRRRSSPEVHRVGQGRGHHRPPGRIRAWPPSRSSSKTRSPLSCAWAETAVTDETVPLTSSHPENLVAVKKTYDYLKKKGIQKIAIITRRTGSAGTGRTGSTTGPESGLKIISSESFQATDAT